MRRFSCLVYEINIADSWIITLDSLSKEGSAPAERLKNIDLNVFLKSASHFYWNDL